MRKTKAVVLGSIFVLSAVGCGGTNRDTRSNAMGSSIATSPATAPATTSAAGRDPAVVRGEEQSLSQQNWREVKSFLSQKGYNPGVIDGGANDQTRQAIMEFQRRNRFAATGLLDSQTLIAMEKNGAGFTGGLGGSLRQADGDPTTKR